MGDEFQTFIHSLTNERPANIGERERELVLRRQLKEKTSRCLMSYSRNSWNCTEVFDFVMCHNIYLYSRQNELEHSIKRDRSLTKTFMNI
jgi:hypothetical protein